MNRCRKLKTASILLALLFTLPIRQLPGNIKWSGLLMDIQLS